MSTIVQPIGSSHVPAIVALGCMLFTLGGRCTGSSQQSLNWSLRATKDAYYPGEPVLLTLTITNNGSQPEAIRFWPDATGAFSIEVRNSAGDLVGKGGSTRKHESGARPGPLRVGQGQTSAQPVVLNRWCSTLLLPAGAYEVTIQAEYELVSESQTVGRRNGIPEFKAGPLHTKEFRLKVSIWAMDPHKFKGVLEDLRAQAFPTVHSRDVPTSQESDTAKEMLALAESTLAVPYQLQVLAAGGWPQQARRDAVNSLARSKTLEGAIGLMKLADSPIVLDVRRDLVDAVYRTRETGEPEIIRATDEFIQKYKRPAPLR